MGRELKRVALDFDWPLGEAWEGFLNPHYVKCPDCDGHGYTPAYVYLDRAIQRIVYMNPVPGYPSLTRDDKEEVMQFLEKLTERKRRAGMLPGGATYIIFKKLIELAGVDDEWGKCANCNGEGVHPDHFVAYDAWEPVQPPAGEGWQLWETVSEGSPISPVFPTKEAFIAYLVGKGYSRMAAEKFCDQGWVPSMALGPDGLKTDINMLDDPGDRGGGIVK